MRNMLLRLLLVVVVAVGAVASMRSAEENTAQPYVPMKSGTGR
jgi:hypothetical protein